MPDGVKENMDEIACDCSIESGKHNGKYDKISLINIFIKTLSLRKHLPTKIMEGDIDINI